MGAAPDRTSLLEVDAADAAEDLPVTHARARGVAEVVALVERSQRVAFMADWMAEGWLTRPERTWLSQVWGVTENCVSRYASDANLARKLEPERLEAKRQEYVGHLERIASKAERDGKWNEARGNIELAADLQGLKAAQKHELTGAGGGAIQLQALPPEYRAAFEAGDTRRVAELDLADAVRAALEAKFTVEDVVRQVLQAAGVEALPEGTEET